MTIPTTVRRLRGRLKTVQQTLVVRFRYWRTIRRLQAKPKDVKIRVLFLNSETSKWKCQSVYRKMKDSGIFDPVIGITALNEQSTYSDSDLAGVFKASEKFFDGLGDRHVRTVELNPRRYKNLSDFSPDIVFFPEPGINIPPQTTKCVSRFALSCYVPYFVFTQSNPEKHCALEMPRTLWRYFVLNESIVREYSKRHSWLRQSFDFVVTGHPALDGRTVADSINPNGLVIYAPHHSIWTSKRGYSTPISTFLDTGDAILEYAKRHSEINWAFKPHPVLRKSLEKFHCWTKDKIDAYFKEWESIGMACYDGNYARLFDESRAMITDCDSFLVEYGATGKPIIHLRRNDLTPQYHPYVKDMLASFYQVHSPEEMFESFNLVLERNEDPKRSERLTALRQSGILGIDAAQNIVDYLRKELRR